MATFAFGLIGVGHGRGWGDQPRSSARIVQLETLPRENFIVFRKAQNVAVGVIIVQRDMNDCQFFNLPDLAHIETSDAVMGSPLDALAKTRLFWRPVLRPVGRHAITLRIAKAIRTESSGRDEEIDVDTIIKVRRVWDFLDCDQSETLAPDSQPIR